MISQQAAANGTAADDTIHVLSMAADGSTLTEVETDNLATYLPNTPPLTRWQGVVAF